MPIDPAAPLTDAERLTFGADAKRHPITGHPIEMGCGSLHADLQAVGHLDVIEQTEGPAAAAEVRQRLRVYLADKHEQQHGKEAADQYRRDVGLLPNALSGSLP